MAYTSVLQPVAESKLKSPNKITFIIEQQKPRKTKLMWTSDVNEATVIRMNSPGVLAKEKALTMHTLMVKAVEKSSRGSAMKYKFSHKDKYLKINYSEYYRLSCLAAKAFIRLGLDVKKAVCIAGFNSPPWFISFIGAIFAGGISSGMYTTNNDDTNMHILNNCSCQIVVVENTELLLKYLTISKMVPTLKAIVQYKGEITSSLRTEWNLGLFNWNEFMESGLLVPDETLVQRLQNLVPNECCSLIYTSGTTGNPKGVMMSHDNLIWTSKALSYHLDFKPLKERFLSYLPLSHVAAQMTDIIIPIMCVSSTWFSLPDALKGTLGISLREVRPTRFIGVPRVWEKIAEQMKDMALTLSSASKNISAWAKDIGLKHSLALMNHESPPFGYTLAKIAVFNNVRSKLGLDKCLGMYSAAAPITYDLLKYFASLDIIISEIYGMSECSGPHTVSLHKEFRLGTVGKCFPEFLNKIDCKNPDDVNGEICMYGRHVFMGYIGAQEKTEEVFDKDNYLHSGDIGKIDNEGFVTITGRIKELIITTSGENIAPSPIENKIKEFMPLLANVMVVGDQRKFLSALLTVKCEINPENQYPTDILTPTAKRWCKSVHYNVDFVSQVISDKNPVVWNAIDEAIVKANEFAYSPAACVKKWVFLPCDFSVGGGELGPTMKLKRSVVTQMYTSIIDNLYEG